MRFSLTLNKKKKPLHALLVGGKWFFLALPSSFSSWQVFPLLPILTFVPLWNNCVNPPRNLVQSLKMVPLHPEHQVWRTPLLQIKLVVDFSSRLCLWKMMRTWPTATIAKISHLWPIHHLEASPKCHRRVMVAYCDRHLIQAHYCTGSVSRYI